MSSSEKKTDFSSQIIAWFAGLITGGVLSQLFVDLQEIFDLTPLKYVFFILSALLSIAEAAHDSYVFIHAKTEQLPHFIEAIISITTASCLIIGVIVLSLLGVSAAAFIFFGLSCFETVRAIFHFGKDIWDYCKPNLSPKEKALLRTKMFKHIRGIIGHGLATAALGAAWVFGGAPSVIIGCTIAAAAMAVVNTLLTIKPIKILNFFKTKLSSPTKPMPTPTQYETLEMTDIEHEQVTPTPASHPPKVEEDIKEIYHHAYEKPQESPLFFHPEITQLEEEEKLAPSSSTPHLGG